MPKATKGGWYAVASGRQIGVYTSWDECSDQVKGFSKAKYKKFPTKSQAEDYVRTNGSNATTGTPQATGTPAPCCIVSDNRSQHESGRSRSAFYAVARGRNPGVYYTWSDCQSQVKGFQKPLYKKFTSEVEAMEFCTMTKHAEPDLDQKFSNRNHSGDLERSCDSSFSDFGAEGGNFSPTRPDEDDSFSSSDIEEGEELEESNNTVLREIAALISRTQSRSQDPDNSTRPVVYTDGSCLNQGKGPRRAGIGVYWGPEDRRNCSERLWGTQTNQRAELWAAIRALQAGLSAGYRKLEVRTDSQYTIKGVTEWIKRWKTNGYHDVNGKPVKNKELFCCLDSLTNMVDVRWVHVKAHCGEPGNEAADRLARDGAKQPATDTIFRF